MRKFIDLHIIPNMEDEQSCALIPKMLNAAGYHGAALALPTGLPRERIRILRSHFAKFGIEMFVRVDLKCGTRHELLKLLRNYRNTCEILAVNCLNHNLALVAARDRRVDIIFFDPANRKVRFDHAIANISNAALELNVCTIFSNETAIARLTNDMNIAMQHKVRIVISSGCSSVMMIRTPGQLSAIGTVLGLGASQAHDGVSTTPWSIAHRNCERRLASYIEDGVTIFKR